MLHSYHYYACYYAMLWFLHQQQEASAMTIIIDGATTQEWNTQDEYQKLIRQPSAEEQQAQLSRRFLQALDPPLAHPTHLGRQQHQAEAAADFQRQPPPVAPPLELAAQQKVASSVAEELGLVLDRLDLMEEQQRLQAAAGQRNQQFARPPPAASSSRSLAELVASGDDDENQDPHNRLKERNSAPKKICGDYLMETLHNVCNGSFFDGKYEPETVEPIIKSKRSLGAHGYQRAANQAEGQGAGGSSMNQLRSRSRNRLRQQRELSGVVAECCRQPCDLDTLKKYCKP